MNGTLISGEITALAVNPSNSADVWIGTANGGAWHSTNGGASWTPTMDTQAQLDVGALALDPTNTSTIYAGMGDINTGVGNGIGILKSTDGGSTWTLIGASAFSGLGIARILVNPTTPSTLLVAAGDTAASANVGLWRSTDGGATWAQTFNDSAGISSGTDLMFDPANPNIVYAGMGSLAGSGASATTTVPGAYTSIDGSVPPGPSFRCRCPRAPRPAISSV